MDVEIAMSPTELSLIISGSGFAASVVTSAFIAGSKFGTITTEIKNINLSLARIEGAFTYTVKQDNPARR